MFEFKASSVRMYDANTLEKFGIYNIDDAIITTEVDTSSLSKEKLSFSHEATFEVSDIDLSSLPLYTTIVDKPSIEYSVPIMIQSRWHKKKRINKKWLKRYGMKNDNVLVKCDVESVGYNTDYEPCYLNEHVECNMTLNNMEYKFRPDQLRKNLKIDMGY